MTRKHCFLTLRDKCNMKGQNFKIREHMRADNACVIKKHQSNNVQLYIVCAIVFDNNCTIGSKEREKERVRHQGYRGVN